MEWGKYSEESFYATMGRSQAPAGQAAGQAAESAGQPGQSKKGRRRDAAASASKKLQPQKSEEVDLDEAKRRLKVCCMPFGWSEETILVADCSVHA